MTNLKNRVADLKNHFGPKTPVEIKYREFTWENQRFEFLLGKIDFGPNPTDREESLQKNQYLDIVVNGIKIHVYSGQCGRDLDRDEVDCDDDLLEYYFNWDKLDPNGLSAAYYDELMIRLVCELGMISDYGEAFNSQKCGDLVVACRLRNGYFRYNDIELAPEYRLHTENGENHDDFEKRK